MRGCKASEKAKGEWGGGEGQYRTYADRDKERDRIERGIINRRNRYTMFKLFSIYSIPLTISTT